MQGQFSISLVGTDFIVSVNTTWALEGNEATQQIWRLRVFFGFCGFCCVLKRLSFHKFYIVCPVVIEFSLSVLLSCILV